MKLFENWRKFLEEDLLEEGVESLHLPAIINTKILEEVQGSHAQTTFGKYFKELAPILHTPTMYRFGRAIERAVVQGYQDWARANRPTPEGWWDAGQPDGSFDVHHRNWDIGRSRQWKAIDRIKRTLDDRIEGGKYPGYVERYDELVGQIKPDGFARHGRTEQPAGKTKGGGDYWKFLRDYEKAVKKMVKKFKPLEVPKGHKFDEELRERILKKIENEITHIYLSMWKMIITGRGRRGGTLDDAGIPRIPLVSLINYLNEHERNYAKMDEIFNRLNGSPEIWSEALDYMQMQKFKDYFEVKCDGPIEQGDACVILKMPDNWFWFNRGTDACPVHKREMANCGKTLMNNSVLVDLERFEKGVDKKPKFAVGIEWNEDEQMIYQVLGFANTFPKRKYWPHIKLLYEFLGKPAIYANAFQHMVNAADVPGERDNETYRMTPNQIRALEKELYAFIGARTDKWRDLDAGLESGRWNTGGESQGQQVSVRWSELVPPSNDVRVLEANVEYAIKMDFKNDPYPDLFFEDIMRWFGDGGDDGTEERLNAIKDYVGKQFDYHFRESRNIGAKFYGKKRYTSFVRRTMEGKKETVILFRFKAEGAVPNTFRDPEAAKRFIREVKRHFRIPILKNEIGNYVTGHLINTLQAKYPDSRLTSSPDSDFAYMMSEGKKIKISIIK
jgi:hypothetical protein